MTVYSSNRVRVKMSHDLNGPIVIIDVSPLFAITLGRKPVEVIASLNNGEHIVVPDHANKYSRWKVVIHGSTAIFTPTPESIVIGIDRDTSVKVPLAQLVGQRAEAASMVHISNLRRMLSLEVAAVGWWSKLSEPEKKTYLKAHPDSKYAGGSAPTSKEARRRATHHDKEFHKHGRLAEKLATTDPVKSKFHKKAAALHEATTYHYIDAADAMNNGDARLAAKHLNRAERETHRIDQHLGLNPKPQATHVMGTPGRTPKPKTYKEDPGADDEADAEDARRVKKLSQPSAPTQPASKLSRKRDARQRLRSGDLQRKVERREMLKKVSEDTPSPAPRTPKASAPSIHTGTSAAKIGNGIEKHFSGKKIRSMGGSNPYDDNQSFKYKMAHRDADRLHKHLTDNGWTEKPKDYLLDEYTGSDYHHPEGGHVAIIRDKKRKEPASVTAWGKKKAKQGNFSIYD